MRTLPLRDARVSPSAVVEAAERGETTMITKHGRSAAVVVPVEDARRPYPKKRTRFCGIADEHPGRSRNRTRSLSVPGTRSVNGWLLDTNVISAFGTRKRPLPLGTAAWFRAQTEALFVSMISAAKLESGIAKLRRTRFDRRAENLRQWLDRVLDDYADRILTFGLAAAGIAGVLGDSAQADGRYPGFADIAIAAIAKARELVLVTLNRRHFDPLRLEMFNPFAPH